MVTKKSGSSKKGQVKTESEAENEMKAEPGFDSATKNEFDQLCRELNMDVSTSDEAWESYLETKHRYTLEVI